MFYLAHLAVFVHGCFWHLCPRHYTAPAAKGFRRKMDANRRRDIRVRRQLWALGWRTMVFCPLKSLMRDQVQKLQRWGLAAAQISSDETPAQNVTTGVLTLALAPNPAGSLRLYVNGIRQKPVEDYTLAGAAVTPVAANVALYSDPTAILIADYTR